MDKNPIEYLKNLANETIDKCTFSKKVSYFIGETEEALLLPSADEKYGSFWVRDCAMIAESALVEDDVLKKYIEIIATHGQNGKTTLYLENGLVVPPYAVADHINYDGKPVYFPGTYESGKNQGAGDYGFYPPFCDNYYYIIMAGQYIKQSGNKEIIKSKYRNLSMEESLEYAFAGYNIDEKSQLCISDFEKHTVDWGFVDSVKKTGKLLMASLLRYNAAKVMQEIFCDNPEKKEFYKNKAETILQNVLSEFYDEDTGWMYSSTGMCKQYDVWATAYAVFSGVLSEKKTLHALYLAYINKTAVVDGYVRQILTDSNFSEDTAWESSIAEYNTYQNGAFWATPTGWYAYALYRYGMKMEILEDFIRHTQKHKKSGAPFEWINENSTQYSGLNYGTSGVLPYIGALRILSEY